MRSLPVVPQLYSALMKISLLRDEVGGFGDGLTAADAARYLSRLHELESNAMRLLDKAETHGRVVRH